MADPLLGMPIGGRYRLTRRLARGRGADLYLAKRNGRAYALKLLDPGVEAGASSLRHPFVVPVHEVDLDRTTERVYVVMDLIEGYPLGHLTRQGPLSVARATRLMRQVLQGLEAAHAVGLVHAHLSPKKILVLGAGAPEEEVRVLGFGLASEVSLSRPAEAGFKARVERLRRRIKKRDSRLVTSVRLQPPRRHAANREAARGAMLYAAPEVVLERAFDARADLYAVGAILYELLSGSPPFQPSAGSKDPEAELRLQAEGRAPRPLHGWISGVPRELSEVLERVLSKAPGDRPRAARDLRKELRRAQDRVPVSLGPVRSPSAPPPLTVLPTEPKPTRLVIKPQDLGGERSPLSVRLLGGAGLLCGFFALGLTLFFGGDRDPFLPVGHKRARTAWSGSAAIMTLPENVTWTEKVDVYQAMKDGSLLVWLAGPKAPRVGAFLGRHEVTWGQYLRYCEATETKPPLGPGDGLAPVTSVTLAEAEKYCTWAGGRLPREAEYFRATYGLTTPSESTLEIRSVLDKDKLADLAGAYDFRANAEEWLSSGQVAHVGSLTSVDTESSSPRRGFRLAITHPKKE